VLRKIFYSKRVAVMRDWRIHVMGSFKKYTSHHKYIQMIRARRMRWVGHVACMGEKRNAEGVLVGKSEGKRPSGRYRHRWEDNI